MSTERKALAVFVLSYFLDSEFLAQFSEKY